MNIPTSSQIEISSEVLSQEVNGETVLLDLKSENYFGLDEVGTRFWQLLQKDKQLQQVFTTMLAEYDVEDEQLKNDLNDLISKLTEAGLIHLSPIDINADINADIKGDSAS